MKKISYRTIGRNMAIGAVIVIASLITLRLTAASAASSDSLYSYDFRSPTLASPVANQASTNTSTALNLVGNWSKSDFGVRFDGDRLSKQSVAYAKPASGNTISVASTQAFGGAVMLKYEGPPAGATCYGDSRNITQIGRFGAGLAQFKLQFSNCGTSSTAVYPECRVAGSKTSTTVPLARSTQALKAGNTYILQCVKSPDPVSGTTTVRLTTTRIDNVNGNEITVDPIQIPPAGVLASTAYLSVANKYALPAISSNTDQFVGDIAKVAYCASTSLDGAVACLDSELPSSTVIVPPPVTTVTEYVTNQSFETDLAGWTGAATSASQNTWVSGGYDGSYSLRSINKSTATTKSGFTSKPLWIDGTVNKATTVGTVYTASAWVKPDSVGQKISLYLREGNAYPATVGSKTVTFTASSTDWQNITNVYTAKASGNNLALHVFASNAAAGKGFNADTISLSIPQN